MNPTDPMTPVRALIEAAGKATPGPWKAYGMGGDSVIQTPQHHFKKDALPAGPDKFPLAWPRHYQSQNYEGKMESYTDCEAGFDHEDARFIEAARAATASISQLLSEHDKVVEYIKELRDEGVCMPSNIYKTLPDERRGLLRCADRLQSIVEGK